MKASSYLMHWLTGNNMVITVIALLGILSFSNASWSWGPCKSFELQSDVSLDKYYGTWYEIVRDAAFVKEEGGKCTRATYTPIEGEDCFQVINSALTEDGQWRSATGIARPREGGSLEVQFHPDSPWDDYEIVDTDYKTYSIVHACRSYLIFHRDVNWILARDPDYEASDAQIETIQELGTREEDIVFTSQTDCPKFDINQ